MSEHIEQAMPVPNDHTSIQSLVRADLEKREQVGISRYGTALQPHNGRDALRDLYEELLDGACYVKQAMVERDSGTGPVGKLRERLAEQFAQLDAESWGYDHGFVAYGSDKESDSFVDAAVTLFETEFESLHAHIREQHEINQGWVAYGGRVKAERRQWREQLAAALGISDERGIVPQMPELINQVKARQDAWELLQILVERHPNCEVTVTSDERKNLSSLGVLVVSELSDDNVRLQVRQR